MIGWPSSRKINGRRIDFAESVKPAKVTCGFLAAKFVAALLDGFEARDSRYEFGNERENHGRSPIGEWEGECGGLNEPRGHSTPSPMRCEAPR